ncbi:flagellar basal body P-ring protein FlgI [Catenovulum sp. 2E275]|uniref:flagellar basal body P-ring protein FlgI n=1 Tax=Catenovulum sp. 2E275 TaxID=2980497 RepID=UPI0021D28FA9|nr:flagellar basal body P-ring protein FlgI [Catenovulum sp. 2E275]MCU4676430.1 flagellar basal body P-ring protein FlgI [Catenovulum sp. 2E275]
MMKSVNQWVFSLLVCTGLLFSSYASAQRIKDLASIQGIRNNQLVGYGLVVGLPGTGEQSPFTEQSFRTMLNNFGISMPSSVKPKIKNVAAVAVSATLPAFAKPGQTIDVTVSSIGSAGSLNGGTLLQTFLKGVDGKVYAVAQGSLVVGGFGVQGDDGSRIIANTPTVGRIANGALVEREVITSLGNGDHLIYNLHQPDFTTAKRLADVINQLVGPKTATAVDATSIQVMAPRDIGQRVSYISTIENLEFTPADAPAKVIVNSRTGTIVIGKEVRLRPAAVTHGGLTVTIAQNQQVSQPNAFAEGETVVTKQSIIDVAQDDTRMFVLDTGASLDELVRAMNEIGAAPGDLMAILEALKEAGALQGELVVI